jgi:hypothetical protein
MLLVPADLLDVPDIGADARGRGDKARPRAWQGKALANTIFQLL